jgi:hypothetical protein
MRPLFVIGISSWSFLGGMFFQDYLSPTQYEFITEVVEKETIVKEEFTALDCIVKHSDLAYKALLVCPEQECDQTQGSYPEELCEGALRYCEDQLSSCENNLKLNNAYCNESI